MGSRKKLVIPQEVHPDGRENERKYSIIGTSWQRRVKTLDDIFNYVARYQTHFVTLGEKPHVQDYDPELLASCKPPVETLALRTRFYLANRYLNGYKQSDKKGELRIQQKTGKGVWEQVLKLGGDSAQRTLRRGEHKRLISGDGYNLNLYPEETRRKAEEVLGEGPYKKLIRLQGQSEKVLYHPDGVPEMMFEIKFDKVKGIAFDGFKRDLVEIEIEVKEQGHASDDEVERMLDRSEEALMTGYADHLELVHHSKVFYLFQHLNGYRLRDSKGFGKAFNDLPDLAWGGPAF